MKVYRVIDPVFNEIFSRLMGMKLPVKTAGKLSAINKLMNEQNSLYEAARRDALNKYGDKNEDGSLKVDDKGNVTFSDENMSAFANELDKFINTEFETPKLKLDELGEEAIISANEIGCIEDILNL